MVASPPDASPDRAEVVWQTTAPETWGPWVCVNDPSERVVKLATDGKTKRWRNLQVPLYSAALANVDELGYFALGTTEADVKLSLGEDFSRADRDSAMACAQWVIGKVRNRVFWPPAEKADFDDYVTLSIGRSLQETVLWNGGAA